MSSWRRRCLEPLVAGSDQPRRTAAAFAIGTFLSFSPLFGLQIASGLAAAFAFRLSRAAMIIGLCANLPWLMLPWYTLTTIGGAKILGATLPIDLPARFGELLNRSVLTGAFWYRAAELVAPFLLSLIVGSLVGALAMGALAYLIAVRFLARVRTSRMADRLHSRSGLP